MDSKLVASGKAGPGFHDVISTSSIESQVHAHWAAAYEFLRPTGEVDSRAKQVLVTSLALIALCLAKQKPDSIDVLGFTFRADDWLILAIPLAIILVYTVVQLCLVWVVEKWKLGHAMLEPISSLQLWLHSMLEHKQQRAEEFVQTAQQMNRRRTEIWNHYKEQRDELWRCNPMRVNPEGFDEQDLHRWHEEKDRLEQQLKQQLEDAGVAAFDEEVNSYLDGVAAGKPDEENVLAEQALQGMKRLRRLRQCRFYLDLCIPLFLALVAFAIFFLAVL